MKKILVSILAVAALLCSCSKFDDSAIRDRIKALDARCEALSSKLNDNAKAISALVKLEGKADNTMIRNVLPLLKGKFADTKFVVVAATHDEVVERYVQCTDVGAVERGRA